MDNLLPLEQWLSAEREPGHLIAFEGQQRWTQRMLQHDVQQLYGALHNQPGERWALCFDNGYRFLVALLAVLHAGKTPVLPGHCREARLREQQAAFCGVVTDLPLRLDCTVIETSRLAPFSVAALPPVAPDAALVLFTSGSTGEPSLVVKSVRVLNEECAWLARLWGSELRGCRVVASVSHQHMYGLTFRVMLPMTMGLACGASLVGFPEQLVAQPGPPFAFISSPAFLKRLDRELDAPDCRVVISAAGKLDDQTARQAGEWFRLAVSEIYGSTETGVLAWRRHLSEARPWQPFAGVEFFTDRGGWSVRSPLVDGGVCRIDDHLLFNERGAFHLAGRRDRVVKIEEKRVSLDEIERRLLMLSEIKEAAVVPITRAGRVTLGAVVVLHHDAGPLKKSQSRWRAQLCQWLEPVCVPRYWRRVESIPLNSQSKRIWAQLQELFNETP